MKLIFHHIGFRIWTLWVYLSICGASRHNIFFLFIVFISDKISTKHILTQNNHFFFDNVAATCSTCSFYFNDQQQAPNLIKCLSKQNSIKKKRSFTRISHYLFMPFSVNVLIQSTSIEQRYFRKLTIWYHYERKRKIRWKCGYSFLA